MELNNKINAFQLMMGGSRNKKKITGMKRRRKSNSLNGFDSDSSNNEEVEIVQEKPKKRGRPRLKKSNNDNNHKEEKIVDQEIEFVFINSDKELKPYMNLRPRTRQVNFCKDKEGKENVVSLKGDSSFLSSSSSSSTGSPSLPKPKKQKRQTEPPKIAKEILVARQEFLKSSLPDNVRRLMEKSRKPNKINALDVEIQIINTEYEEVLPFPIVSHVHQKTDSIYWHLNQINVNGIKLKQRSSSPISFDRLNCEKMDDSIQLLPPSKSLSSVKNPFIKIKDSNDLQKYLIKLIKENKIAGDYLKTFLSQKKSRSLDYSNNMWTNKYSPQAANEILGNKEAVDYLKNWLKHFTFENDTKGSKKSKQQNIDTDDEYDSDFEYSKSEMDSSDEDDYKNSTLIIHGPHGCGKSSSIYALCKEYQIQIIELNTSSRRTGKILMQEFQEATRSHQMNNSCLLLIEDVDLVFENQDEGFLGALQHLTSTTKRPIVLTTNDIKSSLVQQKFANQYKCIEFKRLERHVLLPWLQALCFVEGYYINQKNHYSLFDQFYSDCEGDLRKCLLQLQFLLDCTNEDPLSLLTEIDIDNILKNASEEATVSELKEKNYKSINNCDLFNNSENKIVPLQSYDNSSTVHYTIDKLNNLRQQQLLSCRINLFNKDYDEILSSLYSISKDEIINKDKYHIKTFKSNLLSQTVWQKSLGQFLCSNVLQTDFLPIMRQILRLEDRRQTENPKRGGRQFRHIFQDWNIACSRKDYERICKFSSFQIN